MSATLPSRGDAGRAGVPGLALLLVGLWTVSGPVGVLGAAAVAAVWLVAPAALAVGAGHVVLAALAPAGTPLVALLPAEAGLLWLLPATGIDLPGGVRVVVGGLVAAAAGVALVAWLAPAGVGWAALAAAAVFVGVPVAGVGLDRLVERIEGGPPG